MTTQDSNVCLQAFYSMCEELDDSPILSSEECQYWLFERGYKAALATPVQTNQATT